MAVRASLAQHIGEVGLMPVHDWTRVNADTFHHFHATWVIEISRALNEGILPPDYYAMAEQMAGAVGPDVLTLEAGPADENGTAEPDGGVAVAVAPPRVWFSGRFEIDRYAAKARTVVIRHASGDRIIALLEILSPGNKSSRHALRSFVDKAFAALNAGYHLLLIDLFPPGPRDPQGIHGALSAELGDEEFALPADRRLTLASYAAGETPKTYVQPLAVGEALAEMPLFLTPEVYVPVPLKPTYRSAWDAVPRRWREVLERA
jgi:hypothetical protein